MVTMDFTRAPLAHASAPGKVIVMGEHAVVYGMSALAVPVHSVSVTASVRPWHGPMTLRSVRECGADNDPTALHVDVSSAFDHDPTALHGDVSLAFDHAPTALYVDVSSAPDDDPWATVVRLALAAAGYDQSQPPAWCVDVSSTVPIGAGMGSSAALAVALARSVARAAGAELDNDTISALAFEAEKRTHGTPSGIDNAVVAFSRPVWFVRGQAKPLAVGCPMCLVVADSGPAPPTREMVAGVRARREGRRVTYDRWFGEIDDLVQNGARALAAGDLTTLGRLMNANHLILQAMHLSTDALDRLVAVARASGALGAKLTGAGGGGTMVALARDCSADAIESALRAAGARHTLRAHLEPDPPAPPAPVSWDDAADRPEGL